MFMVLKPSHMIGTILKENGTEQLVLVECHQNVIVCYRKNMGVTRFRQGELKFHKRILTHNINANDDVYFEDYALAA